MFRRGDRNTRKFRNKKIRKSLGRLASFGGWMRKPSLEFLEERRVLSTLTWVGDVDANWNTDNAGDTNWNTNTLPADGDTLVFPAGAANINNNNDTTAGNSYILQFTGTNYTVSGNAITLDLPGVDIVGNTQTVIGTNFTLAADTTVQVNGGPVQTQLNGILSGATGGLTKTGTNFLHLTGTNNYGGATDVQQGFLVLALGGSITSSNAVTVQSGASLGTATGDTGAANAPIDGKAGSTIQADSGATLTLGTAASAAGFSTDGNISIGSNATLTLNDSDNAVLGPSTSLGGGTATLIAANGVVLSAGDVLSGNGTVQGAINVGAGTISPGTTAGDINVTGNVTFGATGTYAAELDGVAVGQFDTLDITGSATLAGAKLDLAGSGHTPVAGNSFVILTTTAGITGNFSDAGGNPLPEGANVFVNGRALSVSYLGNNVTLAFDATPVINAGAGNNGIEVREDAGGNIEVVVDGNTVLDQPLASLTNLTINGEGGDDTLTMNYGAAGGFFNLPVTFNGGGQGGAGDMLVINDAPGTATTVTHTFINANDGSVNIDGTVISYTGLEPVIDNLGAVNRVFDFTGAGETITLDTAGVLDNQIRSTLGESVDFTNPTATLTILTTSAAGADIVNIEGVDAALDADLIITAKATDTVNFQTAATDIGASDFSVTAGTINVNQPISTTSVGALAVDLSATTIAFSATGAVNATGSGEVEITAGAGGITMADGSVVNAGSGIIDIDSIGLFQVGRLVTTNNTAGAIDINAGAITDAGDIGGDDIEATGALAVVTIVSTGGVGTAGNPVETNVNDLNVDTTAANGNQFLTEANGLTDLNLNAGLGDVTLVLTAGGIADTAVDGDDITALNASVTLNGAGNVGALGNDVETNVDSLTVDTSAAGGNQFLTEGNGLTDLDLNAGVGNINLTLAAGGILDNAGDGNDVVGSDAIIISQDGIGVFGNPIETDLINLDVTNNAALTVGIFIEDTGDGLTLADLNGDLLSVNGYGGAGEIRANSPLTIAANAITFGGMTYTAADSAVAGDDLTVNAGITVNDFTSFLTMNGGDDVIFNLGSNVTAATLLTINSDFGNLDAGVGSNINLFGVISGAAFPDAIVITGDADDDVITIDDNAGVLGDGGTVSSVVTPFGGLNINGAGGADTLNLDDFGDATADTFSITDTTISAGFGDNYFDGMPVGTGLTYAGLETINLQTSNLAAATDGDVVTIFSLNAGTTYNLDGNDPLALPGDILNLNPVGPIDMYEVAGVYQFDFGGSGNLNVTEFETINLNPGNGVLNIIGDEGQGTLNGGAGTDEADLVVVTGTGANAGQVQLGHGGVLIAVPPQVNFAGVIDLNINTFELDDQVTITPFATAIQPWNIEVDVDAGAGVLDRLIYNNVATVFDDTSLVATGLGSGRFDAPGIGSATTNEVVTFTGVEDVTANANPGDDDHLTLELPSTDDTATFLFDPDAGDDDIQLMGLFDIVVDTVNYDALTVNGNEGDDTFVLNLVGAGGAAAGALPLELTLNGGPPNASDTLSIVGNAALPDIFTITPGADSQSGTAEIGGTDVGTTSFTGIEDITLDGGGGVGTDVVILNGTGADNAFTLAGTAALAGAARVDAGPNITFTALGSLSSDITLNGLGGSDTFAVAHFADWQIDDVNVNGGPPSASDLFSLVGTGGADDFDYTPNAANGGQIDLTSGGSTTNYILVDVEHSSIDGAGGADTLDATTNNAVVTPGSDPDTGLVEPKDAIGDLLLPLAYAGVETVVVTGTTIVIQGTDENDTIDVSSAGIVTVTNELGFVNVVDASGFTDLVINALGGDDSITVAADAPFNTISAIGGDNGGGSDTLQINDVAAAADTFEVNPNFAAGNGNVDVNAGTLIVPYDGIEHLLLLASGDAGDVLTINDDLADNTWSVAAGPIFGDRVQIDDRESIDLNGFDNVTLENTFGTDTFNVHPDQLTGFTGELNVLAVGAGNDVLNLIGTEDDDVFTSDADTITLNGVSVTAGNTNFAEVRVTSLGGVDNINLDLALAGVRKVVDAGSGNDIIDLSGTMDADIYGGDGDDNIMGTPLADNIYGGKGNDIILGLGGDDVIYGEEGNDTATGGTGADSFFGGDGSDTFIWNQGDGSDLVEGGAGESDILIFNGAAVVENFTLNAVGTRLELLRTQGGIDMDVAGVEQLDINSLAAADTFLVNDLHSTELRVLNIDMGAGDADTVDINGRASNDDILVSTPGAGAIAVRGLRYDINLASAAVADTLTINGNDGDDVIKAVDGVEAVISIVFNGGAGNDFLSADATLNGGAGNDMLIGGAGDDTINGGDGDDIIDGRGSVVANTIDGGAGTDTILVSGTAGVDVITTTHTAGVFTIAGGISAGINNITTMERVSIQAGAGSDTINVVTLAGGILDYDILGGDPIGAVGDTLNLTSASGVTFMAGPENDSGAFVDADGAIISYDEIEDASVTLPAALANVVIMGTGGDDDITAVGTAANTVDVTVNGGPTITYINVATLTLQGKEGDDDITIDIGVAGLGVTFNVDGGQPESGTDELRITGVDDGMNSLPTWTPSAEDAGTFVVDAQTINVTTIERLIYDGRNDGDTLTVMGDGTAAGTDDEFSSIPGTVPGTGEVYVSTFTPPFFTPSALLGIAYENLGNNTPAGGTVNLDGGAGNDFVTLFGTETKDFMFVSFPVVNGIRLENFHDFGAATVVTSANIERYLINTLGDADTMIVQAPVQADSLTLAGGNSDEPYDDELYFTGEMGVDNDVVISPASPGSQTITGLGGVEPINTASWDVIHLDGQQADDDSLTVNLGGGDNTARVERTNGYDRVVSDSLPEIRFLGLDDLAVVGQAGIDRVTFATWFLAGATPGNYTFDGGATDTLVIEGSDGAADAFTVTDPDGLGAGVSAAVTDGNGAGVTVTATNANLGRLQINTLGGDDQVLVDVGVTDLIGTPITFDGGAGSDLLTVSGAPATAVNTVTYTPGPATTEGRLTYDANMTIDFLNLEPVVDLVVAANVVVNGTNADNAINYTAGPNSGVVNALNPLGLATGQVSIDVLETIEFANKTTLTINALAGSDTINLNNPTTPTGLTGITVNGGDPTASDHVIVNGTAAANAITVNTFTNDGAVVTGAQPVPVTVATAEHLTIDGQGGNDTLTVTAADNDEVEYTPDVFEDAGRFDISNSAFGPFQRRLPLSFEDLGAGGSLTVASVSGARNLDLRILGTQIDDRFDVTAAGVVQAFKLGTGFFVTLPINTPGADELFLEGLDGDDVFDIVGNHPFVAGIRVAGGNPGASDVLNFTGSGAGVVTVDLQAQTVTEAGFGPVAMSGIETLNLDAGGIGPTIMGTTGDDDVTVTVADADSGTILIDFAVQQNGQVDPPLTPPVINYSNIGADPANIVTFDLGLGNDTLIVVGNALPQTFTANVPAGTVEIDDGPVVGNDGRISFANTESLELFGLEGSDTFNVTPGAIPVFVDGGDPIGVFPGGDLLVVAMAIYFPGPESDEGAAVLPGNAPVSFDHIESIIVPPMPGGCPILIVGTNGDDDITVIARDASYIIPPMVVPPGLDGVQDFTVTVNQGPEILFIDAPDLYIDALSGDDDIVIRTRAPNGADWDMDVRIVGGPPSAATGDQGDVVEVETPNPAAGQPSDSVIYTPNGSDTGVMVIDENGNGIYDVAATDTQIQILSMFTLDCLPLMMPDGIPDYISSPGGAEALIYDGEGSNDDFRVNAPAGATDDTIVHTPGQAFDEGSIRVNALLGVTYQNLGATATLTVDGTANAPGGAGDRLVVEGTVHSDTFTVANNAVAATAGAVTLNDSIFTRLAIRQIGVENLVLNGLEGDDDFIINQTQPYTSVAVNGGGPGNSDTLTINGAAATAETFTVTPGVIRGEGAVLVNAVNTPYTGIEHLFLAGNAGDVDNITINDDNRDNVWSVSAGTIGDLVQIDGRESIDINTFNDVTLTNTFGTDLFLVSPSNLVSFTGAFTVNGDAALPLDDVLQLLGTPGDDVVTSSATAVTVNGVAITAGANLVEVNVTTLSGADNIDLDLALAGVRKVVDSGDGADTINLAGIAAAGDVYIFAGDGDDNVTGSPQIDLIYGGRGNDVLIGAGGADTIYGEEGNDIFGNPSVAANGVADDGGNDRFFGGPGSDTFVWEPGDGSDTIEGGSEEADVLIFFGGAGDEVFNVFANLTNPARSVLFRNTGSITMDMAGIDQINVHGQGGRDEFVVGRANNGDSGADTAPTSPYTDPTASLSPLNTTEVRVVNVDFGAGDAGEDVFVDGRALNDNLLVSLESAATSVVRVSGLPYDVRILNSTVDDRLTVRGNEGDDVIKSVNPSGGGALNVENVIGITLAGGAGDDYLSADAILIGGIGDDFLEGGAGDDMFFGNQGEDTMVGGTGNDTYDGGPDFDTILIRGTSANDTIDVAQTNATTLQYNITGAIGGAGTETDTLVLLGGVRTVEEARVEAGRGADTIRLAVADALHNDGALNALRMTVVGGDDGGFDRVAVVDTGAADLSILRQSHDLQDGSVEVGPSFTAATEESFQHLYSEIEFIQVVDAAGANVETGVAGGSRLVVFKFDPYELNNDRNNAMHLGANSTVNGSATIDPGIGAFGLPADTDWYRVEAVVTGTIDFQIIFEEIGPGRIGLPNEGDLNINVRDSSGDVIANFTTSDDNDDNERVRIPAVQGEIYFFQVLGDGAAINAYDISVINLPSPVPYDLELDDEPVGDVPPANNSDTGRNDNDNVTRDNTPTIVFRLDDAFFLNDIPGNDVAGNPLGDAPIPIPFRAGPAQPNQPGYAIAIFDEGDTPGGPNNVPPQTPLGFATMVEPGVYEFTTPVLADGSHFLTARVQLLDPATPLRTGFGARSQSLEIFVDTVPPPASFGDPAVADDGLLPDSDVGVLPPNPDTIDDNVTNDVTPSFWGRAEANAIIRVFADVNNNGTFEPAVDVFVGQTVAIPLDGNEQEPDGYWSLDSVINFNDEDLFPLDGLRTVFITAEDVAGNVRGDDPAELTLFRFFLDTQGPKVDGVFITNTTLIGLTTGNTLVRFDSTAPGVIQGTAPITGLQAGDTVVGIDVRPANGLLYAVVDGGASDRIYTVNPITGAATLASTLSVALAGTRFGVDFNPVADRLRIVSDADQNLRVDVATGVATADGALNPANPNVVAAAYTNSNAGATSTTLYTIDSTTDVLNIQDPPNAGTQVLVGNLGFNVNDVSGFDIASGTNLAFASFVFGGVSSLYRINLTTGAATPVGNIGAGNGTPLVGLTAVQAFDLFDPKPTPAPTPLVNSLTVKLTDPPNRLAAPFNLPALKPETVNVDNFQLVGDHNGIVAIQAVTLTQSIMNGVAMANVELTIFEPLLDDRYTLYVLDNITDQVGNRLDGESNANEPQETPVFPSGNGIPGSNFVARFTVDSRPEVAVNSGGRSIFVDTNGNGVFDPRNDKDFTDRDIVYRFGFPTDDVFIGNFATNFGAVADGYDKLAAYGNIGGSFRFLVDTNNDGVPEPIAGATASINAKPIAGNFDGNADNGDEVGLFDGARWYLDTNHSFTIDGAETVGIASPIRGAGFVGDFDGDGAEDLATFNDFRNRFEIDLAANGYGGIDRVLIFGFPGTNERPVAADYNQDGIDDIGLYVPQQGAATPDEQAFFHILVSQPGPNGAPQPLWLSDRATALAIPADLVGILPAVANAAVEIHFRPEPFGDDLLLTFGEDFGLPLFGNFDPPVAAGGGTIDTPVGEGQSDTNPANNLDVNADGIVSTADLLPIIDDQRANDGRPHQAFKDDTAPYLDVNDDGLVSISDLLPIIQYLRDQPSEGEGEGEAPEFADALTAVSELVVTASVADNAGSSEPALVATEEFIGLYLTSQRDETSLAAVLEDGFDAPSLGVALLDTLAADVVAASGADLGDISLVLSDEKDGDELEDSLDAVIADLLRVKSQS